jgi:endoglucanase
MKLSDLLLGATTVTAGLAATVTAPTTPIKKRQGASFQFTGINQAGAEFGQANLPGQLDKDYTWPATSAIDTLLATGMNTIRVPTMMERIIPGQLRGTINETYIAGLDKTIAYITGKGAYAILDPHNFGRYYSQVITDVGAFGAWWTTVAKRYASNNLVIFDTNNEYHDMDNYLVYQLNQAAIDAIRGAGATSQYIFVEGNSWSGAWHWVSSGTAVDMAKLTDPSNKIVYEMHQYLDTDGSGTNAACVSGTIGRERLVEATAWLKQNGKLAILGETAGGANSQCITALQGMFSYMQENSDVWTGWLWWAGGPWWGDYMYSMEPPSGPAYKSVLPSIRQFI